MTLAAKWTSMRKWCSSIAVVCCVLACGEISSDAASPQDERAVEVDQLFSHWDTPDTPGAVVAIIKEGRIIYQRAYGMADLERAVPLSLESVFDIASVSKQFVAMSVLLLQEEGELSLDDDIRGTLPEIPDYGQTISVRHLIHHTSGIRDYMDLMWLAGMSHENSYHDAEIIDLVARQKALDFEPGEEFLYSNSGYLLLGAIVEKVSGHTLGEFTRQHILDPLEMNVSHFYDDFTRVVENRVLSYSRREAGGYKAVQYIFDVVGDTGLLTTVGDLYRWDLNFYDNVLGREGQKLIERMQTPGRLNSGETLDYASGLGIDAYRGLSVVKHSGSAAGYRSQLLRFPDQRFTVIVLSNLAELGPTKLAERVADLYLRDDFTASASPAETESDEPSTAAAGIERDFSASELEAYGGRYYSGELDAIYIVDSTDGGLTYRLGFSPVRLRLTPTAPEEWATDDVTLAFVQDRSGKVLGVHLSYGRIKNIYFEKTR